VKWLPVLGYPFRGQQHKTLFGICAADNVRFGATMKMKSTGVYDMNTHFVVCGPRRTPPFPLMSMFVDMRKVSATGL